MDREKSGSDEIPGGEAARVQSLVPVAASASAVRPRRRGRNALLLIVAAVAALGIGWATLVPRAAGPVVQVIALEPGPVSRVLAVSGKTVAESQSQVSAAVSGRVVSVAVDEGDAVSAGDALVTLDDARQQTVVRQAVAALDKAILAVDKAQADFDRQKALGVNVSATVLEDRAQALASARVDVDRLQAAMEQADLALADYRIIAPISGIVLSRSVEPGDLVDPGGQLLLLADLTRLFVEIQVDEVFAAEVRIGQTAELRLAGRAQVLTGKVDFIAAEVDEVTGGVRVQIAFDEPLAAQIGLTTVANILVSEVDAALTVPRTALVAGAGGQGKAVFVLREGQARKVPVTYVDWPAERVQVTGGLAAGDQVILNVDGLEDGADVVLETDPPAGG